MVAILSKSAIHCKMSQGKAYWTIPMFPAFWKIVHLVGFPYHFPCRIVPNCIMKAKSERRRPFIGDQIEECRDASGLFYILCFQRGYLINWDVQVSTTDANVQFRERKSPMFSPPHPFCSHRKPSGTTLSVRTVLQLTSQSRSSSPNPNSISNRSKKQRPKYSSKNMNVKRCCVPQRPT